MILYITQISPDHETDRGDLLFYFFVDFVKIYLNVLKSFTAVPSTLMPDTVSAIPNCLLMELYTPTPLSAMVITIF